MKRNRVRQKKGNLGERIRNRDEKTGDTEEVKSEEQGKQKARRNGDGKKHGEMGEKRSDEKQGKRDVRRSRRGRKQGERKEERSKAKQGRKVARRKRGKRSENKKSEDKRGERRCGRCMEIQGS